MKALGLLKDYIEDENRLGDLNYAHYLNIIDYVNEAIEELEGLKSRSCENCKFNSSKFKNDELITCDLHKEFTNQRKIIFCGKWEPK